MSQGHVDNYRCSIALWNSGDLDALLVLAANEPDSEFRTSGVFPGVQPVYRGVEGTRQLWNDMRGPWENLHISIERIRTSAIPCFRFSPSRRSGATVLP